jgi:hypothetical protein
VKQETVSAAAPSGLDWKAVGYLVSIGSVFFLGAVAWAKENPPGWYYRSWSSEWLARSSAWVAVTSRI